MDQDTDRPAAMQRQVRRRRIDEVARRQHGIVSRRQLQALGVTRWQIKAEVRARRWSEVGRQALCVHRGALTDAAMRRVAVMEAGPRAALDGESALLEAGLTGWKPRSIRVSVPRGARIYRRVPGVDIRQTRRWDAEDIRVAPVRQMRIEVAAVRAAIWAQTDRQAALLLSMVVQQGLTSPERLGQALLRIRRDRRRAFLHGVLLDLVGGVRSLGELDVVRGCRERGLPEPTLQALRRTRTGTYYLDLLWEPWRLVVEVDGIHHVNADAVVGDAIRQNTVSLAGMTVLRLPLLGLRVAADEFFEQIELGLRGAGWDSAGAA
jgi:very-short-patch-repair endonuclease